MWENGQARVTARGKQQLCIYPFQNAKYCRYVPLNEETGPLLLFSLFIYDCPPIKTGSNASEQAKKCTAPWPKAPE
jgi:hypothetical protein